MQTDTLESGGKDVKKATLAIIIPTRNRAKLAINSAESVLDSYAGDDVRIIISDNSTDAAESLLLDDYASLVAPRVELIRPAAHSGMTEHWNFAVEHALANTNITHFTILTDRMLFKKDAVYQILNILERYPGEPISYTYDRINDLSLPAVFRPLPRSNQLIRIDSAKMLAMSAQMMFPSCLPRMLNSVSPRNQLQELKIRSGKVFSSISPDFNFCYRTLESWKSFIFFDKSLMVNYSQGRSNGASFARGVMTKDSLDFIEHTGRARINECAPLPGIFTVGNAIVHEFCAEKRLSIDGKFPDLSIDMYMNFLAAEVLKFENPENKRKSLSLLREHGWMPGMRFHLNKWKSGLVNGLLGLRSRKFETVNEAIIFARERPMTGYSLFPHPARNYGLALGTLASTPRGR